MQQVTEKAMNNSELEQAILLWHEAQEGLMQLDPSKVQRKDH
jgi:hypothetical protein